MRLLPLLALLCAVPAGGALADFNSAERCLIEHAGACSHGPPCCGVFWCKQPVSPANSCQQAVDQCWARVVRACGR
jgi:hypothetical protein